MREPFAYYNGQFLKESDVAISPLDRGFLYGDGLFDTLRIIDSAVVSYHDHYERLKGQCKHIQLPFDLSKAELRHGIAELLVRNELRDASVRITITRGKGDHFGYGFSPEQKPSMLILVRPPRKVPADLYEKGVGIQFKKVPSWRMEVKSLSALTQVLAKQEALDRQCYETIMMSDADIIYEGTSSNLFMVRQKELLTPPLSLGILAGITRKRVIELVSRKSSHGVREVPISRSDLMAADEVFLTNTTVQILPVTRIGKTVIGDGTAGSVTRQTMYLFQQTLSEILE